MAVAPLAPASANPGPVMDWPALFAGAVVATAIALVFASLGAALGLSAVSPQQGEGSVGMSLVLTGIWAVVTTIASYAAGGYVAGRMRRRVADATGDESRARDVVHGLVVWGLGLLIGAWVATGVIGATARTVGSVASGAAQAAGAVAQGAGQAVAGAAGAAADAAGTAADEGGLDLSGFNPIEAVNNRLLRGTGEAVDPDATISPAARDVVFEVARTGELTDDNRALLADELAANTTLTEQEANARIDQAVEQVTALRDEAAQRVEAAKQAARDAADAARKGAVTTGILVALAAAVALASAVFGALAGGRHRETGQLTRWLRWG